MTEPNAPSNRIADMIASGDYWNGPVPDPTLGMDQETRDEYFRAVQAAMADTEMAGEIGLLAMSLMGGGSFESLERGSSYPEIPEGSRRAIRVVEDNLLVVKKRSGHHRNLQGIQDDRDKQQAEGTHPGFDALAEMMLDPGYMHVAPAYDLRSASWRTAMSITRMIYYMRPVFDGRIGVNVSSVFAQSPQDLENARPEVMPLVPIGDIYVRGDRLSKIVRADVVEAEGIVWRDGAPKQPPKPQKSLAHSLVPRFVPGSS